MKQTVRRLVRWWRQADRVVITIIVFPLLALFGLIGAGDDHFLRLEHFDAKQVFVTADGTGGLDITEIVDVDFARNSRHGYQRDIPDDFGMPTDVSVTSSANSDLDVEAGRSSTRIRIGSRYETFSGKQRYSLNYTLPDAGSASRLSLDVIGTEETLSTERLDIWISGLRLDGVDCDRGRWAAEGGCTLVERDGLWFASIDDLRPREGVTINANVIGRSDGLQPPVRPAPAGWSPQWAMAALLLAAGAATMGALYLFSRWYGTNRVGAGGGSGAAFPDSDRADRRIADSNLARLAATDFSPPGSMRPWQGALAVNESIDERSIVAWFSEMVAIGALDLEVSESGVARLRRAENGPPLGEDDERIMADLFRGGAEVSFGAYGESLGKAWERIARQQESFAAASGWWHRTIPTYRAQRAAFRPNWSVISFVAVLYVIVSLFLFRSLLTPLTPLSWLFSKPAVCIIAAVGATAYAAYQAFAPIRPARSVMGTAATLRVLGFRRFLELSEGRHVEQAWDRRRIREYSAWAVALGAATAWADHVELLPAPSEPIRLDWVAALERFANAVDTDAVTRYRSRSSDNRADPWRAVGRSLKSYAEHSGSSGSRGGGGRGFSGGSRSRSSGVGSGGGGGRSSTW